MEIRLKVPAERALVTPKPFLIKSLIINRRTSMVKTSNKLQIIHLLFAITSLFFMLFFSGCGGSGVSGGGNDQPVQTGSISGYVKDENGNYVEGVVVTVIDESEQSDGATSKALSTVTDNKGYYEITGVTTGDRILDFYDGKAGYGYRLTTNVTAGGTQADAKLEPTGEVTGKVTESVNNKVLSGVKVSIAISDWNVSASSISNNNGSYEIPNVQEGTHTITALKSGYISQTSSITVKHSETNTKDFVLSVGGSSTPSGYLVLSKTTNYSSNGNVKSQVEAGLANTTTSTFPSGTYTITSPDLQKRQISYNANSGYVVNGIYRAGNPVQWYGTEALIQPFGPPTVCVPYYSALSLLPGSEAGNFIFQISDKNITVTSSDSYLSPFSITSPSNGSTIVNSDDVPVSWPKQEGCVYDLMIWHYSSNTTFDYFWSYANVAELDMRDPKSIQSYISHCTSSTSLNIPASVLSAGDHVYIGVTAIKKNSINTNSESDYGFYTLTTSNSSIKVKVTD
jgi:hypothetical protein